MAFDRCSSEQSRPLTETEELISSLGVFLCIFVPIFWMLWEYHQDSEKKKASKEAAAAHTTRDDREAEGSEGEQVKFTNPVFAETE